MSENIIQRALTSSILATMKLQRKSLILRSLYQYLLLGQKINSPTETFHVFCQLVRSQHITTNLTSG